MPAFELKDPTAEAAAQPDTTQQSHVNIPLFDLLEMWKLK